VLRLKFSRKSALAVSLGDLLAEALRAELPGWTPDLLVPVPIHWRRGWDRGFNQSELLAQRVQRRLGIPAVNALRRTRYTPPQLGLTRGQRATNLQGAFIPVRADRVIGQRVVLVDDVWTTGATLAECAQILIAAGATAVYALTVSHEPD
jgi:ComF family protein